MSPARTSAASEPPVPAVVDEARARAERIRGKLTAAVRTLAEASADLGQAYRAGDWRTLGYATWADYVAGEYAGHCWLLPREERPDAVAALRAERLSTRAIAATLGVSKGTVDNDLVQLARSGQLASPGRAVGIDGRERLAHRPAPEAPAAASAPSVPPAAPPDSAEPGVLDGELVDEQAPADALLGRLRAAAEQVRHGREAARQLNRELAPPDFDRAADQERLLLISRAFRAVEALADLAATRTPAELAAEVPPYSASNLDRLPTAAAWLAGFDQAWRNRR